MFLRGEIELDHCRVSGSRVSPPCCFMSWTRTCSASSRTFRRRADVDRGHVEWGIADFTAMVEALILAGRRERASELIDSSEAQPGNEEALGELGQESASIARPRCRIPGRRVSVAAGSRQGPSPWPCSGNRRPFPLRVPEAERAKAHQPPFPPGHGSSPGRTGRTRPPTSRARFASPANAPAPERSRLVVASTREEAEERHRTRQDYVLAVRRPDAELACRAPYYGRVRTIRAARPRPAQDYHVEVYHSEGRSARLGRRGQGRPGVPANVVYGRLSDARPSQHLAGS